MSMIGNTSEDDVLTHTKIVEKNRTREKTMFYQTGEVNVTLMENNLRSFLLHLKLHLLEYVLL